MQRYFEKFPDIVYNGYTAKNLMSRSKILEKIYSSPDYFKSFELENAQRADNVAYQLYKDQYFSWLIYLSNKIIDPYYDWNLNQYDFDQFLKTKYGSLETAQVKVAYWSNNWYDDQSRISVSFYNNTLIDDVKKYWEPVFSGNSILEYKRRENDWVVNTNQIWEYTVSTDDSFEFDEKVYIYNDINQNIANGQVLFSNSSLVRLHQVFGESNTVTGTIRNSNTQITITDANLIYINIPETERVYWSPVSYYDVEEIKNNDNQTVRVLSDNFAMQASLELKRLINP
jgi:hypothetical protein